MAVKSTKIAIDIAPIGIINVSVNDVCNITFGMRPLSDNVRSVPQSQEVMAFEKRKAVIKV